LVEGQETKRYFNNSTNSQPRFNNLTQEGNGSGANGRGHEGDPQVGEFGKTGGRFHSAQIWKSRYPSRRSDRGTWKRAAIQKNGDVGGGIVVL